MNVSPILPLLSTPRKIAITTHFKPDGDAIGSSLGLLNYFKKKGHKVHFISPSDYPDFLHWMRSNEETIDIQKSPEIAAKVINDADLIFCLDFNMLHRCNDVGPLIEKAKGIKILIDHHLHPDHFCEHEFSDITASATCELVYRFICELGDRNMIDQDIAECLYTGIMTDTGSFRFDSMKANTHRIIADLMETGIRNYVIHENIYDAWSEDRMRLLAYSIEKMKVLPEYHTAIISLTREELNRFNHATGDTEGIVNIPLSIKNIRFAAFFVERRNEVKISFRSKGDFNARDFAADHFEGGGHKNAAGGMFKRSIGEAVEKFLTLLPEYKTKLTR